MEGVKIPLDLVKIFRLWVVVVCERERGGRKKGLELQPRNLGVSGVDLGNFRLGRV